MRLLWITILLRQRSRSPINYLSCDSPVSFAVRSTPPSLQNTHHSKDWMRKLHWNQLSPCRLPVTDWIVQKAAIRTTSTGPVTIIPSPPYLIQVQSTSTTTLQLLFCRTDTQYVSNRMCTELVSQMKEMLFDSLLLCEDFLQSNRNENANHNSWFLFFVYLETPSQLNT